MTTGKKPMRTVEVVGRDEVHIPPQRTGREVGLAYCSFYASLQCCFNAPWTSERPEVMAEEGNEYA